MTAFTVRDRCAADLPACVELARVLHGTDGYPMQWQPDPVAWLSPDDLLGAWVGEVAGRVAGHLILIGGGDRAEIGRLMVAPTARRIGLATGLLSRAVAAAHAVGRTPWLEVLDHTPAAIALYEARGWRLAERAPASWTLADGRRPVLRRYELSDLP